MSDWFIPDDTVRAILRARGEAREIADQFRVSDMTVSLYKRLRLAKARRVFQAMVDTGERAVLWLDRDTDPGHKRFTPEQVAAIRASKEPSRVAAKRLGCSASTIRMIRTRRTYLGV